MSETSSLTMVVFVAYIMGVFVLAGFSHRLLSKKAFLGEYFLGSRGLGVWALAFTFAATSASGGSFGGYPSLIYSYGWVLAFWIGSYMIVPLTTMGIIGKRLNQVARKTNAITIPDVLRDRFESTTIGLFASCIIIFFTICFLIAQFKLGALIIEDTFNLTFQGGYEIGLVIFAITVIFYTAYGGFRAVVWTDVMQGVVMGIGVVILVPIVMAKSGGLKQATHNLVNQNPTLITSVPGPGGQKGTMNDLVLRATTTQVPAGLEYRHPEQPNASLTINWDPSDPASQDIQIDLATDDQGYITSTGNDVKQALENHPQLGSLLKIEYPYKNNEITTDTAGNQVALGATGTLWLAANKEGEKIPQRFTFIHGDDLVFGPGRSNRGTPFHPLGLAISFFFMWAIVGIAQPGTMVRLMAFQESGTLKRAILTVTIYYSLIYLPLVFIVVAAKTELPALTAEDSDRAIVLIATRLVADMGIGYQILGAVFVAAPFAAVMSTVDSLLLMISSAAVRDVYQRTVNPKVSERTVRWSSYATTAIVGIIVTILASRPPDFLQKIIVFVSGGFAAVFLFPVLLGLYWKGMTRQGALWGMIVGLAITLGLFLPNMLGGSRINLLGFHPTMWGLAGSFFLSVLVSKMTGPPPQHLIDRYFYQSGPPKGTA